MTASWVMQTSERPPCVAVAVRSDRYSHDIVLESETFALSVLRDDQVDVATHFADTSGEYHDKLQGIPYGLTPGGSPFLLDCLAYLDCKVIDRARAGDHTVVVGEVTATDNLDVSYPLIYDPSEYEEALR
jgi:flavin reductase (DIM6/NTAB) family NADH-FMN oxidoreductase RutF